MLVKQSNADGNSLYLLDYLYIMACNMDIVSFKLVEAMGGERNTSVRRRGAGGVRDIAQW